MNIRVKNFIAIGLVMLNPMILASQGADNDISKSKPDDSAVTKGTADLSNPLNERDTYGAMLELGTLLAMGKVAYLAGGDTIKRDFDYDIQGNEFEYFSDRLLTKEYLKFDDNTMGMNWGHAYAGMVYYQAFRNHNFNFYESILGTFAASTTWEVLFEYKELVSINDQIVTTFGGAVLGESLFQLSEMLANKPGRVPRFFSGLFNPAKTVREWFGGEQPARFKRSKVDDIFNVYTGIISSSNNTRDLDKTVLIFGFDASVDSMRGNYDSLSGTPTLVEMKGEFGFSEAGWDEFQMSALVVLGGYHYRTAKKDKRYGQWHKRYYLGPSMGIEYAGFGADEEDEDFYAVINLLGGSAGADWQKNQLNLSMRGSLHGDFSMVKPFASQGIENYRDFYWNSKSSLWENAYSYALGYTLHLAFDLSFHDIALGLSVRSQRWDSIDNKKIERFVQWNPNRKDLDFKDNRDRVQFKINYSVTEGLQLGLHIEKIYRKGEYFGIDDPSFYAQADDIETRTWLQVNYQY